MNPVLRKGFVSLDARLREYATGGSGHLLNIGIPYDSAQYETFRPGILPGRYRVGGCLLVGAGGPDMVRGAYGRDHVVLL